MLRWGPGNSAVRSPRTSRWDWDMSRPVQQGPSETACSHCTNVEQRAARGLCAASSAFSSFCARRQFTYLDGTVGN